MTGSSLRYLIKEGGRSIWANRVMSFASILVQTVCLLLIGGAVIFSININQVLDVLEKQNDISIYLIENIDSVEKDNILYELKNMEGIESITFISKDEGLSRFESDMQDNTGLFEDLKDDNPLPDLIKVQLNDVSQMEPIVEKMTNTYGVLKIRAATDVATTLISIRNLVTIAGLSIVGILIIVSLVLTANTIKLTIFSRKKEINIMKYVGATDTFIKLPFVVEGIYLGLIAAIISFFITWGYYNYLFNHVNQWFDGFIEILMINLVPFNQVSHMLLFGFLISGFITGMFGSLLFIKKHIKV